MRAIYNSTGYMTVGEKDFTDEVVIVTLDANDDPDRDGAVLALTFPTASGSASVEFDKDELDQLADLIAAARVDLSRRGTKAAA